VHRAEEAAVGVGVVERPAVAAELAQVAGAGRELERVGAEVVAPAHRERAAEQPFHAGLEQLLVVGRLVHLE
jgi:hypothetical protein